MDTVQASRHFPRLPRASGRRSLSVTQSCLKMRILWALSQSLSSLLLTSWKLIPFCSALKGKENKRTLSQMRLLLKALPQKVRTFSLPWSGWGASVSSTCHHSGCPPRGRRGAVSKGACGLPPPYPFPRPTHCPGLQKYLLTGAQEHEAAKGDS